MYDVPAVIDYVLEQTGSQKVQYISHSVGGKNFISGLSLRPEYNEKVGVGITMGPAGFMAHMFNGFARLILPILRMGEV
jgi:gastric triacylglycerol lipase